MEPSQQTPPPQFGGEVSVVRLLIGKKPVVAQKPGIFWGGKNATPNCRDNPSSLKITTETEMAQIGGMVVGSAPGIWVLQVLVQVLGRSLFWETVQQCNTDFLCMA